MKLSTIFQQLAHGEFHELSFGSGQGVIGQDDYARIADMVHLGVVNLYKRFKIKEGRLWLQLIDGKYEYVLHSDHALSTRVNKEKYIIDSKGNPFINDINKIESISTQDGFPWPFNALNDPLSVTVLRQNVLEFNPLYVDRQSELPEKMRGTLLKVTYRAGYNQPAACSPLIVPEMVEIPIPDMYLEALLYFVASRVYNPIGFNQDFHQGNNFAAKFEAECQRITQLGLELDNTPFNDRFSRSGFC